MHVQIVIVSYRLLKRTIADLAFAKPNIEQTTNQGQEENNETQYPSVKVPHKDSHPGSR
jgi:hypothetical protein